MNPGIVYQGHEKDGKPFCDSLQVAETFGKRYAQVLRDKEDVLGNIAKTGRSKFGASNITASTMVGQRS